MNPAPASSSSSSGSPLPANAGPKKVGSLLFGQRGMNQAAVYATDINNAVEAFKDMRNNFYSSGWDEVRKEDWTQPELDLEIRKSTTNKELLAEKLEKVAIIEKRVLPLQYAPELAALEQEYATATSKLCIATRRMNATVVDGIIRAWAKNTKI